MSTRLHVFSCILAVAFSAVLAVISCNSPEPETPVTPSGPTALNVKSTSLLFGENGGTQTVTFVANKNWKVSSSQAWCKVSQASGKLTSSDVVTIEVTCDKNDTYAQRMCDITVICAELSAFITVTQTEEFVLNVADLNVSVPSEGQNITLSVSNNESSSIKVSASVDWIKYVETKALSTKQYLFSVEPNSELDDRQGRILFEDEAHGLSETVFVNQSQKDSLSVYPLIYEASPAGETIRLNIGHNVDYTVSTDAGWIHEAPATKGLSYAEISLTVDKNTTADRSATIYVDSADKIIRREVVVSQKLYHEGTIDDPCPASQAFAIAMTLEPGAEAGPFYIKGFVNTLASNYADDIARSGNAYFYMTDAPDADGGLFYCNQVLYLEGKKFTSSDQLKVGDEVVVYGKITNANGTAGTVGDGTAYIYSLNGGTTAPVELRNLQLRNAEVSSAAGSQFVTVEAVGDWTLQIEENPEWASLSRTSGNGTTGTVILTYTENTTYEDRTLTLVLSGTGCDSIRAGFKQHGKTQYPHDVNPDTVASWLELPATQENDGRYFFTHNMTVGRYEGRNYSFYLDADAKVSVWVAYPLNKALIGTGYRTNEWGLDPKVPRQYQPVIYSAFKGGYERGHQLPSADRYSANTTAFYGTNITPQRGELNENAWATLEGYVRNWSNQFDTLYVVTGADINGTTEYAIDNDGKHIAVPVGYFKALLGYKKSGTIGITGTTGGYTAIGFYFKHQSYADSQIMGQSMTIDELEQKTGFDFFVNLPSKIGDSLARKVESTNDSWWK